MNPLSSERLRLRELRDDDLPELISWWQDPAVTVTQRSGPMHPGPAADLAEQFRAWSRNQGVDAGFTVVEHQRGAVVGHVSLYGADAHNRTATFAIMIGPPHQGVGYGTEATRLMLRYGFTELGLHRIQLGVLALNQRGLRTYRRAGFTEEGRARESVFRGGRWHDYVHMGILAREWHTTAP